MKNILLANLIFSFHFVLGLFLISGWHFASLHWLYISALALTLVSEVILGYCILSKWEFDLRKREDSNLDYDPAYLSYYTYKFLKLNIPRPYIKYTAIIFLITMLTIHG